RAEPGTRCRRRGRAGGADPRQHRVAPDRAVTRVAYLVSRYPAVSHSFIEREVLALRELDVEVDTFSLRRASDGEALSATDRAERETTYALQPIAFATLVRDKVATVAHSPGRFFATFAFALRQGSGLRGRLWQAFYFVKAVLLLAELRRRDLRHLHVH